MARRDAARVALAVKRVAHTGAAEKRRERDESRDDLLQHSCGARRNVVSGGALVILA